MGKVRKERNGEDSSQIYGMSIYSLSLCPVTDLTFGGGRLRSMAMSGGKEKRGWIRQED